MIYTTYFAKLRKLPDNIEPISIAIYPIRNWSGKQYKKLAPTAQILSDYKKTGDEIAYTEKYQTRLSRLDADEVVKELRALAKDKDIALVCYEKPSDFCHRHLVAKWLKAEGYEVEEFVEK